MTTKLHALQDVAIVGGGLAGLTLARILQVHGVQAVVYERAALRELAVTSGATTGALALKPEMGQRALRAAKLASVMKALVRMEGQDLRICDKAGRTVWEELVPAYARNRAEVDSAALRDTLIDSLYPAVMRWDHVLTALEPASGGGYWLQFAHGESAHAELVLGADGRDSVVRATLSPGTPISMGVDIVQLTVADAANRHPALAALVGPGSLLALQDGKGLMAQRHTEHLRVEVALPSPEEGLPWLRASAADARAGLASQFETWAPPLAELVQQSDDGIVARSLMATPEQRWERRDDVTLLGEAAHAVPLLHGGQANLALLDALELAYALLQADDVASGLRAYEAALFSRVAEATEQAVQYLDLCMAQDGAHRLAQWMALQVGGVPE